MSENQNPEQIARDHIDKLLKEAGWKVQSLKKIDMKDGIGQSGGAGEDISALRGEDG